MLKKGASLNQIIGSMECECKLAGDIDTVGKILLTPAFINDADDNSITYCPSNLQNQLELIEKCKARVIFCSNILVIPEIALTNKVLILVSNPKLSFVKMVHKHYQSDAKYGIDPTAIVDKEAEIDSKVYVGPYCTIGKCKIGKGTIINENVHIHTGTTVGNNCVINTGTVVGVDGMDFTKDENGLHLNFPHIAGVVIEDNVWVGANTTIIRGILRDTVIGYGTVIGHLCCIGHQVMIGNHCLILTHSMIGGSSHIGNNTRISIGSCINSGISIGSNVLIGMGSVVTKNIGDSLVAYGVPAKEIREVRQKHAD